jgi:ATP-binding cassette subfamily B protein
VEDYQKGMTGFARMLEILDEPPEKESTKARIVGRCKGDIRFQDVCFSYDEQTQILDHVTLSVRSGQRLALVGPSGAGKTTICSLLPRFYDCQSGTILIDNLDISQMTLESLRENIGIVEQDVFLIAGSIFENIVYGNPKASKEDVIQAAKDANIHEFVQSLPDGYETYVGERGMKLSGGQKQRIAIARAFLKNPPILILDEATSALDTTTELSIQQSLEKLCKDRTTIVVAHRLSTIKNATRIAVISDGIVAEYGNHSDLIQKKGIYYKMYQAQFINL